MPTSQALFRDSLCATCQHARRVATPRGSIFLLCSLASSDQRYPKYPPQPQRACAAYRPVGWETDRPADA